MSDKITMTPSMEAVGSENLSPLDELVRLDGIVRDCEHSLLVAERLKARGRWQTKWDNELAETHEKLVKTLCERDWLDGAIARCNCYHVV